MSGRDILGLSEQLPASGSQQGWQRVMCFHPAAATVHSAWWQCICTYVTDHALHSLRHRHTLFSPPYFVPPFATLLWGHWQRDGANNWQASNVLEDLLHCTWVIMLNPAQARCAEERNESCRGCFLLAIGVRLHRFILGHLFFNGVL